MSDGTLTFSNRSIPPTNISSGKTSVYTKGDGYLYSMNQTGIEKFIGGMPDGWIPISTNPSYVSGTSIVFIGVSPLSFPVGTKVKFTQSGTVKYFYVLSAVYAGTLTLTLTGGSDYTVANVAITEFYYSHGLAYGFPDFFNYTPVVTSDAGSAGAYAQTNNYSKFKINNGSCLWTMYLKITNIGSWTGRIIIVPPVNAISTPIVYPTVYFGQAMPTKAHALVNDAVFQGRTVIGQSILMFGTLSSEFVNNDYVIINTEYQI